MEQIPKKIFVLDRETEELLGPHIFNLAELLKIPVEVKVSREEGIAKLPKDYDIYFLHLSQIDEQDLKEIRDNQPWSYFVGEGGGTHYPEEVKRLFDEIYYIFQLEDLERIIKEKGNLTDRT